MKVMNYVYAFGIFVIMNAALYSSAYTVGSAVSGEGGRYRGGGGSNIGVSFGSVNQGGGALGLNTSGTGGGSRM